VLQYCVQNILSIDLAIVDRPHFLINANGNMCL